MRSDRDDYWDLHLVRVSLRRSVLSFFTLKPRGGCGFSTLTLQTLLSRAALLNNIASVVVRVSLCWVLYAQRKRTIQEKHTACLIASPVTFAEAFEHCWDWACHRSGVGEAFIWVIYSSLSLHVTIYLLLLIILASSGQFDSEEKRDKTKFPSSSLGWCVVQPNIQIHLWNRGVILQQICLLILRRLFL